MSFLVLILLVALPAAGAVLCAFAGGDAAGQRRLGLLVSAVVAVLGVGLLCAPVTPVQAAWFTLPGTGATVHFSLASDGLSAWLVQLATLITPLAILGAARAAGGRMREFVVAALAMESLIIGALLARDLVLFVLCYEAMLVPMITLIAIFGGHERRDAAMRFVLFTMAGSVSLLVATWWIAASVGSTDLATIAAAIPNLPTGTKYWLFWATALAFLVKIPVVPLHGWQAHTYEQTSGAAAALLAGVMAKLGIYGLLRFTIAWFPEQSAAYSTLFIVLGVIATVGGALAAIVQDDAKRMIAFSSLSHLGLLLAGIFTFRLDGLQGAGVLMVAHGFSIAALFLLIGALEARGGTTGLYDHGGLTARMPRLTVLFVVACLATAGLPGTANFVGEFLLLKSLFAHGNSWGSCCGLSGGVWLAGLAGLSVILTVVYLLVLVQRWFFGKAEAQPRADLRDLDGGEMVAVVPLLLLSLALGFFAAPLTGGIGRDSAALVEPAAEALHERMIETPRTDRAPTHP